MTRILLIHWNAAEAEERAELLRKAGHRVVTYSEHRALGFRKFVDDPPQLFVIDLSRLPSHGREMAGWIRRQKATRHVPLVLVGGEPEKVDKTRALLPDAAYSEWRGIRGAIRRALAEPLAKPVVPGTMAGYSGTPLPKKLGIKPGATVVLVGAPREFQTALEPLPEGVAFRRSAGAPVILFARSRADLRKRFPGAVGAMAEGGSLWIAWPKQASGVATDLSEAVVRAHGLDRGFVDYKICAIDATWSGLCFAKRRPRK